MLERRTLSESLKNKMESWHHGLIPMPAEYVKFHKQLAHETMGAMLDDGLKIHNEETINDGWFDGMKVVQIIVEDYDEKLYKAKWNDSNQNFMVRSEGGGWMVHKLFDDYQRK